MAKRLAYGACEQASSSYAACVIRDFVAPMPRIPLHFIRATCFINGKMKRVRRPLTIDGMDVDEFLQANADLIWLHQNELWHLMPTDQEHPNDDPEDDIPF